MSLHEDVIDAVRTLLAVRQYTTEKLPSDIVERIAEAAHLTASAANFQPWHFVFVQERATLERLGHLATTGAYILQAQLAVVVGIEKASAFGVSGASRAIQDMMLAAWSAGVGSNWVGFRNLESVFTRVRSYPSSAPPPYCRTYRLPTELVAAGVEL